MSRRWRNFMNSLARHIAIATCILAAPAVASAQSISNLSVADQRFFVVGVVPVVGNGVVGGVAVDAKGAVEQAKEQDVVALRDARRGAEEGLAGDVAKPSKLRKISLRRLESLVEQHASQNK